MPYREVDTDISRRTANRGRRRSLSIAIVLLAAIAVSPLVLKFAPAPIFWLWLAWATAMFTMMVFVHGSWLRAILLDLGIVACMLAAVEAYLIHHEYIAPVFSSGFNVQDDVLGWAPQKGMLVHAFKANPEGLFHHPEGALFDVTYTIDGNGLRVSPPWRKNDLAGTVLFFGCSYTFGEGLPDNETLPYQVGRLSGGRYRTINFAFEGYSPAQMLASLEHGRLKQVMDTTPTDAFYVAAPIHVWRVAGRTSWGGHAPRYILTGSGAVTQAGFIDSKSLAEKLGLSYNSRIKGQLDKSALWRMLSSRDSRVTDDDIRVYLAVVRRSQELLTAQYPGIRFHIILWPNQNVPQQRYVYEKMRAGFLQMGYPLHLVEDILPAYWINDRARYILGPADHHPNALADQLLAEFILSSIQQQTQAAR